MIETRCHSHCHAACNKMNVCANLFYKNINYILRLLSFENCIMCFRRCRISRYRVCTRVCVYIYFCVGSFRFHNAIHLIMQHMKIALSHLRTFGKCKANFQLVEFNLKQDIFYTIVYLMKIWYSKYCLINILLFTVKVSPSDVARAIF